MGVLFQVESPRVKLEVLLRRKSLLAQSTLVRLLALLELLLQAARHQEQFLMFLL